MKRKYPGKPEVWMVTFEEIPDSDDLGKGCKTIPVTSIPIPQPKEEK